MIDFDVHKLFDRPQLIQPAPKGLYVPTKPKLYFPKPAIHRKETSFQPGFRGGAKIASVTFLQYQNLTTDLTTYTFTAANLGSYPFIGLGIMGGANFNARTVSSVTIDGVSAVFGQRRAGVSNIIQNEIWLGASTGDASGDIVITFSGGMAYCGIAVFGCRNIQSTTPTATDTETADNTAMTASVNAGGIGIAFAGNAITGQSMTWSGTGVTGHGDSGNIDSSAEYSAASAAYATAGTASFTVDFSVASNNSSVLCTYR